MSQLDFITVDPPNAATPLHLLDGRSLDQPDVYMRNNFVIPTDSPGSVAVELEERDFSFSLDDLTGYPSLSVDMVLECAGNGRIFMSPIPDGTPWNLGGASPVTWRGVRLLDVLGRIGDSTQELVFTGADSGTVEPEGRIHYQFSLDRSLWDRAILATQLGEEPLSVPHGGPIRLVVPGQYAMKSVKWLTSIAGASAPFEGHFVAKYRYFGDESEPESAPVGIIRVRSLISHPGEGARVDRGDLWISGSAWSGAAPVETVELNFDDGPWLEAELKIGAHRFAAVSWRLASELEPGFHRVSVRAADQAGNIQPTSPSWNRNGYANNLIHTVGFEVI